MSKKRNRDGWYNMTDEEVVEARELYATGKHSFFSLGKLFGVSGTHISNLIKKKRGKKSG